MWGGWGGGGDWGCCRVSMWVEVWVGGYVRVHFQTPEHVGRSARSSFGQNEIKCFFVRNFDRCYGMRRFNDITVVFFSPFLEVALRRPQY